MSEVYILEPDSNRWSLSALSLEKESLEEYLEELEEAYKECLKDSEEYDQRLSEIEDETIETLWEIRYINRAFNGKFNIVIVVDG